MSAPPPRCPGAPAKRATPPTARAGPGSAEAPARPAASLRAGRERTGRAAPDVSYRRPGGNPEVSRRPVRSRRGPSPGTRPAARWAVFPAACVTVAGRARPTPREHEVAALAVSGMTNADLARRLTLSVRTVENHLPWVYGKLGVASRTGLREHVDAPAGSLQPVRE
ncbi:helix-turn-helix domain-containing protein [Streptomyces viridosporus]|uniref:helix-turn-helix domain-containing protein n=1 Tax=Streptomyces viridosporus TaxID=67581 RepID=UPI000D1C7FF3|nr:helix-turn-helix transcriptional regulator [Streptomyces viridosporus]